MLKRHLRGIARDRGGTSEVIALCFFTLALLVVIILFVGFVNNNGAHATVANSLNPNDTVALKPCESSAQAKVTLFSTHTFNTVHYKLYLDECLKAEGDLKPGAAVTEVVNIVFPTNQSGDYKAVLLATSDGGGFGDESCQAVLTCTCNDIYTVNMEI